MKKRFCIIVLFILTLFSLSKADSSIKLALGVNTLFTIEKLQFYKHVHFQWGALFDIDIISPVFIELGFMSTSHSTNRYPNGDWGWYDTSGYTDLFINLGIEIDISEHFLPSIILGYGDASSGGGIPEKPSSFRYLNTGIRIQTNFDDKELFMDIIYQSKFFRDTFNIDETYLSVITGIRITSPSD